MNTVDQYSQYGQYGDIETALRGELSARADSLEAAVPPYTAVRRAVRRDRGRRLAGAASGLALVAALIVTLTQVLGSASGPMVDPAASAPSALLTIPTRGNLAADSAFIAAVKWHLDTSNDHPAHPPTDRAAHGNIVPTATATTSGYSILYANDDGTHRVVIGGEYDGRQTFFAVLIGDHAAAPSALKQSDRIGTPTSTSAPDEPLTFIDSFTTNGAPVPFVVLGPTNMTNVEYATGMTLTSSDGRLTVTRSKITQVATVDGAAAGEIPGASTLAEAAWLDTYTVFRAEIGGRHIDADPFGRMSPAVPGTMPFTPAYKAIMAAVAEKGRAAGLNMTAESPGGDAVPDNVAAVFLDLARFDSVPISSLTYQVDWIGRETAQWDAALVNVHAPGLPSMQIFVRGLTAGAPDSASPGLARTFIRPAGALEPPGDWPHTAASFGGTPEPATFGEQVMSTW